MNNQWDRKVQLTVFQPGTVQQVGNNPSAFVAGTPNTALDLSQFRIKFYTSAADVESPNSCAIRVYNLSLKTIKQIQGEFSEVVLSAGYVSGNYGIIFSGSIKQFRIGRENATDTYLDILAADGDIGYNQAMISASIKAGATPRQAIDLAVKSFSDAQPGMAADIGSLKTDKQNIPNPRGQVFFGMSRAMMRNIATSLDAAWSIQDGKIVVTDNTGYHEGQEVAVNVGTGLIGLPQQTDQGIKFTCLLNSRIRIGNKVKLDNSEITQLVQQNQNSAPISYNSLNQFYHQAPLSADGVYRALVIEHEGDTRGNQWYTNVVGLAFNDSATIDKETNLPLYVLRN